MEEEKKKVLRVNDLSDLLFLMMILSILLGVRITLLPEYFKESSVFDIVKTKSIIEVLILPLIMVPILFIIAIVTKERVLKYIYLSSILPFILEPKLLFFIDKIFVIVINILLSIIIITCLIIYTNKNYFKKQE